MVITLRPSLRKQYVDKQRPRTTACMYCVRQWFFRFVVYDCHWLFFSLFRLWIDLADAHECILSFSDGVATRVDAPPFYTRYVTRVFKTGAVPPPPPNRFECHVPLHFTPVNFFAISTWWQYAPYLETTYRFRWPLCRQSSRYGLCLKFCF
jgi:hypothetical protein